MLQSFCDQVQFAEVVVQEAATAREKAFRRDTQAAAELAEFSRLVVLARNAGAIAVVGSIVPEDCVRRGEGEGAALGWFGARARPCCAGCLGLG